MSDKQPGESAGGFSIGDIYFVLFRHKWKIIILSLLGFIAAAAVMVIKPAPYQSEGEVQIRTEGERTPGPPGSERAPRDIDSPEMIIIREIELLKSHNVGLMVATNLGPERILGKPGTALEYEKASGVVLKNLLVEQSTKGSSVVKVIFQHPDKDLVQPGLEAILAAYGTWHEVRNQDLQSTPAELAQQKGQLTEAIHKTEQELKTAKEAAGVTSLTEDKNALIIRKTEIMKALDVVRAQLAPHAQQAAGPGGAVVEASTNAASAPLTNAPVPAAVPAAVVDEYEFTRVMLSSAKKEEYEDLYNKGLKDGHPDLVNVRRKLAGLQDHLRELENHNPGLLLAPAVSSGNPTQPSRPTVDPAIAAQEIIALQATANYWESELARVEAQQRKIEDNEGNVQALEASLKRQRENLEYFLRRLEEIALNNKLGNKSMSTVSPVSSPTPAVKKWSKPFQKKLGMLAFSGVIAGLGLAFLIEFMLDRTVKRPIEIETKLRLPLFISIPDVNHNGHRRLAQASADRKLLRNSTEDGVTIASPESGNGAGQVEVAPWDKRHALHRFYEGLRDRLIVYFEVRNLVHKPKLVAVTSCNKGAGVSSIAAGLAAGLSHTGDGNVLLVDMNEEQGSAQQFYKGRPGCGLDAALESGTMQSAFIEGNLYVATERLNNKVKRVLPGGLATMLPKLKASDYDYIIFDMPPVSQTSMTPRLAGLMDMVLLVIESEKTNQDVVKRATALLGESKAIVSTVLNKTRNYVPAQLHQDSLEDT